MPPTTVAKRGGDLLDKLTNTHKKEAATAASQVALGFIVPFAVQLGMGASAEAGAMRAGLQGLLSGVAIGGGLMARMYTTPGTLHDYYDLFAPLGVAAVYAAGNDVMALAKSQGPVKDFTFSAVSGYATLGLHGFSDRAVRFFMEEKTEAAGADKGGSSSSGAPVKEGSL